MHITHLNESGAVAGAGLAVERGLFFFLSNNFPEQSRLIPVYTLPFFLLFMRRAFPTLYIFSPFFSFFQSSLLHLHAPDEAHDEVIGKEIQAMIEA
jgi:hypothetical protein